ncbi:MAG TPA: hypothetical protein VGO59_20445 [Verrucomicrobiae bacterium]
MRRFFIILCGWLALGGVVALAGTFPLTDGTKIVGTPESIVDKGVVFQFDSGDLSPRIDWERFTPDALRELMAEAKTDAQRTVLQPMIDNIPQDVAKRKEIVIKPVEPPFRPKSASGIVGLFGSPAGWFIILVLYGANLFAAYEVSIYRRQPMATVCGLAAIPFVGVLSPIIYGAMPTQRPPPEPVEAPAATAVEGAAAVAEGVSVTAEGAPAAAGEPGTEAASPSAPAKPAFPDPIVFARGEFSFNRRFFETKFAGFFRVIPSEAEKDLVLQITCSRGKFAGRRVMRITPNELYLQVFKGEASSEEMIPFGEISEVQIRHKDSV